MRIAAVMILLCAGSGVGYADAPARAAPGAPVAPGVAAAPAAATADAAATPVAASSPPVDAAQAEADAKKAAAAEKIKKSGLGGYKPEVHGNNTVYCKVELKTGSRFSEKQCRTYEQLLADQQTAKDYTEQIQKMGVQSRQ